MMRRLVASIFIAAALAGCDAVRHAGPPRVGAAAPAYAAKLADGRPASLQALRGTPVLLNVWATWCHPCREELPALEQIHRKYAARGLRLVGTSIDDPGMEKEVVDFARSYGVTYEIWMDPDQNVNAAFAPIGVPNTYLIGRDGTLLWTHVGPVRADDPELNRLIEQAVASKS